MTPRTGCRVGLRSPREGDMVFINVKNINRARSNVKLDHRNIGPYRVEEVLSSLVCKLELLVSVRIWPYFHVNLFELVFIDLMIN